MATTPAQKLLADIREKQAHRDRLLRELDLWAAVQAQGIAVDAVDRWGFDPALLTPRQAADAQRAVLCGKYHPYTGERTANGHYLPKMYNYVRLRDGARVTLDPMLEAVQRVDPFYRAWRQHPVEKETESWLQRKPNPKLLWRRRA